MVTNAIFKRFEESGKKSEINRYSRNKLSCLQLLQRERECVQYRQSTIAYHHQQPLSVCAMPLKCVCCSDLLKASVYACIQCLAMKSHSYPFFSESAGMKERKRVSVWPCIPIKAVWIQTLHAFLNCSCMGMSEFVCLRALLSIQWNLQFKNN